MVLAGHPCICRVGCDVDLERHELPHSRAAQAVTGHVSEPAMARAIGQAFQRPVAAKTEILLAGGADRPAASLFAQFEQGAVLLAENGLILGRRLCFSE